MGVDTAWIGLAISIGVLIAGTVRYFHVQLQQIRNEFDERMDTLERNVDRTITDRLVEKEKYLGTLERHDGWLHQMQQTIASFRREIIGQLQGALATNQVAHEKRRLEIEEVKAKLLEVQLYLAKFTTGDHSAPYKPRNSSRDSNRE